MKKTYLILALLAGSAWANQPVAVMSTDAVMTQAVEALTAPQKVDDKDLEATMKALGKNFRALRKAETIAEMKEPAEALQQYASQAEFLGLNPKRKPSAEAQATYQKIIREMRAQIVSLQAAIAADDVAAAKKILAEIGAKKDEGHDYFDVK